MSAPFSWPILLAIATGAVVGAWSRYLLAVLFNRPGQWLPWGTFVANVIGGLMIGMALAWFERRPETAAAWRPLLITGFLGALTTFSTFSAESLQLLQRGAIVQAFGHSVAHLVGSLLAAAIGWRWLR